MERFGVVVSIPSSHFELFGDQGATVWRNQIIVEDDSAQFKLTFWFKAIVNHKIARFTPDETNIRQPKYSGVNVGAAALFEKLKSIQKNGYESSMEAKELLEF